MEKILLKVQTREIGKKQLEEVRSQKRVPAVVYGSHGFNNLHISALLNELKNVYKKAGTNTIVELEDESTGKKIPTIIRDVDFDKVSDEVLHADFYFIRMDEKIETDVDLIMIGDSEAVKLHGGILVHNKDSIRIRCLPAYLVHQIEVDISVLKEIGQSMSIKDLKVSEHLEILDDMDELVASISEQQVEKETTISATADTATTEGAKPETTEKGN